MLQKLFLLGVVFQLTACATTDTGEAFLYFDDDRVVEAIPYFEKSIKNEDRIGALMLAFIYANDTHIPLDIEKAQQYLNQYSEMPISLYDQYLDYFHAYAQAIIWLEDDEQVNDETANKLLRASKYKTFPPALSKLAKNYANGIGVKADYNLSHLLYEESINHQETSFYQLHYAWQLSVHHDEVYRQNINIMHLMPELGDVDENYDFIYYDTKAAVLARQGLFLQAVEQQNLAIQQISRKLKTYPYYQTWLDEYVERKGHYQQNKPWVVNR